MFLISSGIKEKLLEVPLYSLKFLFSFLEAFKSGSFLFLSYSSLFLLSDNISYASEIFLNFSEALSLSGFLSGWYLKANFLYKINKNFNLTNDCLDLKNEIEKHFKSELDLPYDEELIEKFEREIQDADLGTSDDLVEEVYQNRLKEIEEISYIQAFNNTPEISKLLHDIRKDKPSFRSLINHNDLEKVICVKPQLNNNRIIRQQGCFLLLGIDKIK